MSPDSCVRRETLVMICRPLPKLRNNSHEANPPSSKPSAIIPSNRPASARGLTVRTLPPAAATVGPLSPWSVSKANPRSRADWKRCSGFFSRQRCTIRSSAGGVAGAICEMPGGSSFRMAVIVSVDVGLRNARLPVSISYKIAPKAKMSARWSAVFPRTCSGDM